MTDATAARAVLARTWGNPDWRDQQARDTEHTADPCAGERGTEQTRTPANLDRKGT